MANNPNPQSCRLCHAPIRKPESTRLLCDVCDEYAQHVALQSNRQLERVVGDLQNGSLFMAASRNAH